MPPLVNYDSPQALRAFLDERGLGMRKRHGQNFLISSSVRTKLLDALDFSSGDSVWEIGPGLGAMTTGLLERRAKVTAFEIDPAFAKALTSFFSNDTDPACRFNLIQGDVLKTWQDTASTFTNHKAKGEKLFLLGNLPYNIAAALIADFIEKGFYFFRSVITVQREVAKRMCARPGSKDYSSFSVLCSSVYKLTPLALIKPASFYPAPRVDSQAVRMDILPPRNLPKLFYPLVRSLFSSRRKTIRNTLSNFAVSVILKAGAEMSASDTAREVLKKAGIAAEERPEKLGIDEFAALATFLEDAISNG